MSRIREHCEERSVAVELMKKSEFAAFGVSNANSIRSSMLGSNCESRAIVLAAKKLLQTESVV
jgi:hypothetical protein